VTEPQVVKYAKYGSAVLGFMALLFVTGVAVITTAVRWAAAPIIREESLARQVGDSLIVSRLEAVDRKQNWLGEAMRFEPHSKERKMMLNAMQRVQPRPVTMPDDAKVPEK
jgi:hypothetical protein